jgi:group I intron endonuclease
MTMGIYTITSPSGKQYVGATIDFTRRKWEHFDALVHGTHPNPALQASIDKYGLDGLQFKVLLVCAREHLQFFEQRAMDVLCPDYNWNLVAGTSFFTGYKHSLETRAIMSEKAKNRKRSEASKAKLSKTMLRLWLDPEYRDRSVLSRQRANRDPETRRKISESLKGVKKSAQHAANISRGQLGICDPRKGPKNSIWITDGQYGRRVLKGTIPPEGWKFGMPPRKSGVQVCL